MNLLFVSDIFGQTSALDALAFDLQTRIRHKIQSKANDAGKLVDTTCRDSICHNISCHDINCHIVDPYAGERFNFADEAEAYQYFSTHSTIEKYANDVSAVLAKLDFKHATWVIGFSAGASAVWRLAASLEGEQYRNVHAVGFYGGQIRHLTELSPLVPIHLVFPKSEAHFDIDELIETLGEARAATLTLPSENQSKLSTTVHSQPEFSKTHFSQQQLSQEKVNYFHGFMNKCSAKFDPEGYAVWLENLANTIIQHCD